jgi:CBS domain-containing protein
MQVETVMTSDVWTCGPHDTLEHAAHLMWERDCGVIPVVDRDRRVVGMVTDRDVCMAAYTKGRPLSHVRVDEIMSCRIHAVCIGDSVSHAEHLMREFQVRRLPVVDGSGYLVGLFSLVDLARCVTRAVADDANGPNADSVSQTLAEIGTPHRGARSARARLG